MTIGDECRCRQCEGCGPEDEHEVCECYECHEAGCHNEDKVGWSATCEWCDALLVDEAMREAEDERMDLQKGDNQ